MTPNYQEKAKGLIEKFKKEVPWVTTWHGGPLQSDVFIADEIASALEAQDLESRKSERERCARIAENFGCEYCSEGFVHDGTAHGVTVVCSNDIAKAIRELKDKE